MAKSKNVEKCIKKYKVAKKLYNYMCIDKEIVHNIFKLIEKSEDDRFVFPPNDVSNVRFFDELYCYLSHLCDCELDILSKL